MTNLLPCPFCGEQDEIYRNIGRYRAIVCRICLTEGPLAKGTKEAAKVWNTRHTGDNREALVTLAFGDSVYAISIAIDAVKADNEEIKEALSDE